MRIEGLGLACGECIKFFYFLVTIFLISSKAMKSACL